MYIFHQFGILLSSASFLVFFWHSEFLSFLCELLFILGLIFGCLGHLLPCYLLWSFHHCFLLFFIFPLFLLWCLCHILVLSLFLLCGCLFLLQSCNSPVVGGVWITLIWFHLLNWVVVVCCLLLVVCIF